MDVVWERSDDGVKDFPFLDENEEAVEVGEDDEEGEEAVLDRSSSIFVYSTTSNFWFWRLIFICVSAEGASYAGYGGLEDVEGGMTRDFVCSRGFITVPFRLGGGLTGGGACLGGMASSTARETTCGGRVCYFRSAFQPIGGRLELTAD